MIKYIHLHFIAFFYNHTHVAWAQYFYLLVKGKTVFSRSRSELELDVEEPVAGNIQVRKHRCTGDRVKVDPY